MEETAAHVLPYPTSGSTVKDLPAMQEPQETPVQSLGQEEPLKEDTANYSCFLPWRIPMDRGAWWTTVHGVTKSQPRLKRLSPHITWYYIVSHKGYRFILCEDKLTTSIF